MAERLPESSGINRAERGSLPASCTREVSLVKAGTFQRSLITGLLLVVTALASANDATSTALAGDPVHGKALYRACSACHSVDENDLGPKHRGVFGRRAGSVGDYSYSAALKASGLTWDRSTLDRWPTRVSLFQAPRCTSRSRMPRAARTSSRTLSSSNRSRQGAKCRIRFAATIG